MLRKNRVTASLRVNALTQVLLDLNHYHACVDWYPASLHHFTISKTEGRRI